VRERIDAVPFLFGENMNAKITLTIPMEKVPKEITRILDDINIELQDIIHDTSECINITVTQPIESIKKIEEIRKKLNMIDFMYDDCYTILLGHVKYETEKRLKDSINSQKENKDGNQSNG
jgi:flagellar motor component MotA